MKTVNDGGPAFPLTVVSGFGDFANDQHLPGMSLQDFFAGLAMHAMIPKGQSEGFNFCGQAYKYADAMLKVREETSK